MKTLSDKALITNLTNNQILAIQNAKVVILDLNDMYQEGKLQIEPQAVVTALQPQHKAREYVATLYKLNMEQKRAFIIITEHLDDVFVSNGIATIK